MIDLQIRSSLHLKAYIHEHSKICGFIVSFCFVENVPSFSFQVDFMAHSLFGICVLYF